jgi:hypothetical protein
MNIARRCDACAADRTIDPQRRIFTAISGRLSPLLSRPSRPLPDESDCDFGDQMRPFLYVFDRAFRGVLLIANELAPKIS